MKKLHILKEFVNGPILARKGFDTLASKLNTKITSLGGVRVNGYHDYDNIFSRIYSFRDEDAPIAKEILEHEDWSIECFEYEESPYFKIKDQIEELKQKHLIENAQVILNFCLERAIACEYQHWMFWSTKIKKMPDGSWHGKFFTGYNLGKITYTEFKLNNGIWEKM